MASQVTDAETIVVPRWKITYAQRWGKWITLVQYVNSYEVAVAVADDIRKSRANRCVEISGPEYVRIPA